MSRTTIFDFILDEFLGNEQHQSVKNPGKIEWELPGVAKKDINIKHKILDGLLTITITAIDRRGNDVIGKRTIKSNQVDIEKISAEYVDGLLTIHLPLRFKNIEPPEGEILIE